jgi:CubicO group peptidase (beta-lactamase class C family)
VKWIVPFLLTAGVLRADPSSIRALLQASVEQGRVPGVVVEVRQRGATVLREAAGYADLAAGRPVRPDDIFMIASCSKPFAATAIMTLVERRMLRLDDPVRKFFPEFPGSSTVRQLLSHTSGIFANDAPVERLRLIRDFNLSLQEAVDGIVRSPLIYAPGKKYAYGGASFCVAGRFAEILTGMGFDEFLHKSLLEPLNLEETFYRTDRDLSDRIPVIYSNDAGRFRSVRAIMETAGRRGPRYDGFILVPGGLYSTAADTLGFLEMHLNRGIRNGRRILSEASALEMRKKQTGNLTAEYGLGWARQRVDPNGEALAFGHGGGYGTEIWVDEERELAAVIFTQMPSGEVRHFIAELRRRIEETF